MDLNIGCERKQSVKDDSKIEHLGEWTHEGAGCGAGGYPQFCCVSVKMLSEQLDIHIWDSKKRLEVELYQKKVLLKR